MIPRRRGFTLVEILVSLAILAILFGLIFRPLLLGLEVLSISRAEKRVQSTAREIINQLGEDLQQAVAVYSNLSVWSLQQSGGGGPADLWRTPQRARLDLVLPARQGPSLITPVQPGVSGALNQPKVVTYWLMRGDPLQPYDPDENPRRVFRAQHAYLASPQPTLPGAPPPPRTPDDLYDYAVALARATGQSLSTVGDDLLGMFQPGGPFDWYVAELDVAAPAPGNRIMRGPDPTDNNYTNSPTMAGLSTLTDLETDVWNLELTPELSELEELQPNGSATAYRGRLARWVAPYQRSSDGLWTLPSSGLIDQGGPPPLPVTAVIRPQASRDGGGPLEDQYVVSIEQDPSSPRVGHPMLYRIEGGAAIPVYDIAEYPNRVFADVPGQPGSAEMACGIAWESGELVFAFPQEDVILPAVDPTVARINARQLYRLEDAVGAPPVFGGGGPAWWEGALTYVDAGGNLIGALGPFLMDEYLPDEQGTPGVWTSYTVSSHRPTRLGTTAGSFNGDPVLDYQARQLNMSIVPGSESVVVEVYRVSAPNAPPASGTLIERVPYAPLRTTTPGSVGAGDLEPRTFHLDYQSGRLTFYDPQLDDDATVLRDGLNPPAVVPDPTTPGTFRMPVIRVRYEYRNNLPTIRQLRLGNDANRDVIVATYRSLEAIGLKLTLDVPTESRSGRTETVNDPLGTGPFERPEGARRRLVFSSRLPVGSRR